MGDERQVASGGVVPASLSALIGVAGCAGNSRRMSRHKEALSIPGMSPLVGASQSSSTEAINANSVRVSVDAWIIARVSTDLYVVRRDEAFDAIITWLAQWRTDAMADAAYRRLVGTIN